MTATKTFQREYDRLYRQTKRHGPGAIPWIKVGKYLRFNEAEVMAWLNRVNEAIR